MAFLPLGIALILLVLMTILPSVATDAHGKADHPAALLIFWAMSAGFVRGVGFIPLHWLPRLLLSGYACTISLALAFVRLYVMGRIDLPL
jgi:predicted membrane protein